MKDKVVVITGASGGIGRAVVLALAARGTRLALASRTYPALAALADEVKTLGGEVIAVTTDVTKRGDNGDLMSEAVATFGRIDALVNCAGVGVLKPADQLTDDDIDIQLMTNTRGVILATQAAATEMLKTGGAKVITPVGSMGRFVMRGSAAYSASKWGAVGALKAMATEYQRSNIGFSLLYLGGVDSPFWDKIEMRVQRDKMPTIADAARAIVYALEASDNGVLSEMLLQPESHQFI